MYSPEGTLTPASIGKAWLDLNGNLSTCVVKGTFS